ncbi:MAG TPA: STAS domain-containing protein [Rhodanobacteraceae bacterium]|nr:STAS domain-containing protein [Rhodanobacteraceae bacterium]
MARANANACMVTLGTPDRDTLALSGALTFATAARVFADGARALSVGTQTRLDLGGVTRVDSAGLACVLGLAASASRAGRRLGVVHWPEGLRALAAVCDVETLLDQPAAV